MTEKVRQYEHRYGKSYRKKDGITNEEIVAAKIVNLIKQEAPTYQEAAEILRIAGAMLNECKIN